jgi:hypothetical protein
MVDGRHDDEVDVTGMGKGVMNHPLIAVMFGVGVAFGGGQLGAQVPPKLPVKPMSKGEQWRLALTLYVPVLLVPTVLWFITREWAQVLLWSGVIGVTSFFALGLVAIVRGYRHSKAGRID